VWVDVDARRYRSVPRRAAAAQAAAAKPAEEHVCMRSAGGEQGGDGGLAQAEGEDRVGGGSEVGEDGSLSVEARLVGGERVGAQRVDCQQPIFQCESGDGTAPVTFWRA
jgi:hypothetical protein